MTASHDGSASAFESQLVAQVVDSLAMHMMDNARFMAERLNAEFPRESNAYLLGVCNYWCDKAYPAYEILRGCTSAQSRYMFALCCMKLGRYLEAEKALEAEDSAVPNGAYGQFLLGRIAKLSNRHDKAVAHFEQCLLLNPMMWSAFEELCALGAFDSATSLIEAPDACTRAAATITTVAVPRVARVPSQLEPMYTSPVSGSVREESNHSGTANEALTPQLPGLDLSICSRFPQVPPRYSVHSAGRGPLDDQAVPLEYQTNIVQKDVGTEHVMMSPAVPVNMVGCNNSSGQAAVVKLLRSLGKGYRLLMQFKSEEAVDEFSALPYQHFQTPWVLTQVGKAHFEMVNYSQAKDYFEWSKSQDPYRVEGLEWYSTVLWHMKKEVEISNLAKTALSLDRLCPQAWCVMGNCFSLQKEHETALRFFQRALQIDPHFTYAYTLCGHEYFANEDFDKSLAYYRNAITQDPRHYNAWYGIGQIYYRQEKYEMAINNFKHALNINPRSSVLMCYLGMAHHKQGRSNESLKALAEAIMLDDQNPLARYEYASVLVHMDRLQDAIAELEKLKVRSVMPLLPEMESLYAVVEGCARDMLIWHVLQHMAPREASVYFQMGKIYKKLKMRDAALTHFCHALDLKPTSTDQNLIKSAIENLHVEDEEVDDEM